MYPNFLSSILRNTIANEIGGKGTKAEMHNIFRYMSLLTCYLMHRDYVLRYCFPLRIFEHILHSGCKIQKNVSSGIRRKPLKVLFFKITRYYPLQYTSLHHILYFPFLCDIKGQVLLPSSCFYVFLYRIQRTEKEAFVQLLLGNSFLIEYDEEGDDDVTFLS